MSEIKEGSERKDDKSDELGQGKNPFQSYLGAGNTDKIENKE